MAIVILDSDRTTRIPYDDGVTITIAELIEKPEFTGLHPVFAENVLRMIRDNPSIGIGRGGGPRSEEGVIKAFYKNYRPMDKGITFDEYDNDPKMYAKIKDGAFKWNPEDKRWYKRVGKNVAVPGGSWHTGGFAVDLFGNTKLAGQIAKDYNLFQVLAGNEKHHFQPAGVPTSKRMYTLIKEKFGIDAIATPLPKEIVAWVDSEIASNVPRHPERVLKKLGTLVNSWKKTGSFPMPKSVAMDGTIAPKATYVVSPVTPSTQPPPKSTTTTVPPKAGKTATTTTLPDLPEPSNKETKEARDTRLKADWVMQRSDALVKSGMSRAKADKQALKDMATQYGKQPAGVIPTTTTTGAPAKTTTTTDAPTTTTTAAPRRTTTTTDAPATTSTTSAPRRTTTTTGAPATTSTTVAPTTTTTVPTASKTGSWNPEAPGAVQKQLDSALAAFKKPEKDGRFNVLGVGLIGRADLNELIMGLRDNLFNATNKFDLEAPGAAKQQYDSAVNSKKDPITGEYFVVGAGWISPSERNDIITSLKTVVESEANGNNNAPGQPSSGQPKDYGGTKPAKPINGDTYTNSKGVKFTFQNGKWVRTATLGKTPASTTSTPGATVVVDGKKVVVGSPQWKTIVQEEFGSMWDVYNSDPEVKKVIDDSVKLGYFDDETKMTAKLQNTTWFRTTQQSARQFAIQQSTDPATAEARIVAAVEDMRTNAGAQGYTLNDMTLRKLATDSLKFGWSDQQKLNALGSEQVAQAQLGGAQGMADLRQSATARTLRAKAAAYFQKPSEEMIGTWTQQILTGQKSEVQFDELMRSSARTQFRSLQPALDRGEDVDTAMYAYKQQAMATLGSAIDATQIDWTQDKWNKALNFRDPKTNEYRQMDLWEWNKYLRSLPEWQNTEEAKVAYGNLSQSLARGFGKTA